MDVFLDQPVDYQHPLNRGLRSWAVQLKELRAYGFVDLCKPSSAIVQSSGVTISSSKFGLKSLLNTSTDGMQIPLPSRVHGGVSATLAILARAGAGGTNQRLVDTKGGSDDYYPYSNGLIYTGALRSARVDAITPLITFTDWFWTYWTTNGTTWTMYQKQVNGPLQVASTTTAESTVYMPSTYYAIGHDGGGGSPWMGNFQGAFLWDRCLPAREIHAHTIEWQQGFPNLLKRVPYASWYIPVGGGGTSIEVPAASLVTTRYAPTVLTPRVVTPPTLSMTTTKFAPVIGLKVIPPVKTLTLATFAPTVVNPKSAVPPTATLTTTRYAPVIGLKVIPPTKNLTITPLAPVIKFVVTPPVKTLTLTTFAPTATGGAGLTIIPPTKALTTTTLPPTVITPVVVTPGVTALILTKYTPTVQTPRYVIPPTKALTLTTLAPTVTVNGSTLVTVPKATLTLTSYAPIVTVPSQNIPYTITGLSFTRVCTISGLSLERVYTISGLSLGD